MERSEFAAAQGLDEGINGPRKKPVAETVASVTDLVRKPLDEDPAVTARATAKVKAMIAERRAQRPNGRLVLRRSRPGNGP